VTWTPWKRGCTPGETMVQHALVCSYKDRHLLSCRGSPTTKTYISGAEQISWSWISRGVKPVMTVLAKPCSNLTDLPTEWVSYKFRDGSQAVTTWAREQNYLNCFLNRNRVATSNDCKGLRRNIHNFRDWLCHRYVSCSSEMILVLTYEYVGSRWTKFHAADWMCWFFTSFY
jgi:hypothetical protein